jgi:hypothetical protein
MGRPPSPDRRDPPVPFRAVCALDEPRRAGISERSHGPGGASDGAARRGCWMWVIMPSRRPCADPNRRIVGNKVGEGSSLPTSPTASPVSLPASMTSVSRPTQDATAAVPPSATPARPPPPTSCDPPSPTGRAPPITVPRPDRTPYPGPTPPGQPRSAAVSLARRVPAGDAGYRAATRSNADKCLPMFLC